MTHWTSPVLTSQASTESMQPTQWNFVFSCEPSGIQLRSLFSSNLIIFHQPQNSFSFFAYYFVAEYAFHLIAVSRGIPIIIKLRWNPPHKVCILAACSSARPARQHPRRARWCQATTTPVRHGSCTDQHIDRNCPMRQQAVIITAKTPATSRQGESCNINFTPRTYTKASNYCISDRLNLLTQRHQVEQQSE